MSRLPNESGTVSQRWLMLLYPLPLILMLVVWGVYSAGDPQRQFIFSSPPQVWSAFLKLANTGELARNTGITIFEALSGFLLGTAIGASFGRISVYSCGGNCTILSRSNVSRTKIYSHDASAECKPLPDVPHHCGAVITNLGSECDEAEHWPCLARSVHW